jgi:hypothetical protein
MTGYFTEWAETNLPSKKGVPGVLCVPEEGSDIELEERIAIIQHDAKISRELAEPFAHLNCMTRPTSITPRAWKNMQNNTGLLLDNFAQELNRCGWSVAEIFGVHKKAPERRMDCMGFLMLLGENKIIKIEKDKITLATKTGKQMVFYKESVKNSGGQVMIWELNK